MKPIVVTSHAEVWAFKVESVLLTATPFLTPLPGPRCPFAPSFAYLDDIWHGEAGPELEVATTAAPIVA